MTVVTWPGPRDGAHIFVILLHQRRLQNLANQQRPRAHISALCHGYTNIALGGYVGIQFAPNQCRNPETDLGICKLWSCYEIGHPLSTACVVFAYF